MDERRKREMSSFDLLMLRDELGFLAGGRIQKIFQKAKQLRFEVFVAGKGAFELLFEPGKLFVTEHKREASNERFSQYLRKHLSGQRIASIRQVSFERIVEIETEKNILALELFSKGNAILCDKNRTILMPLERQEWRDRKIAARLAYKYPPALKNPFAMDFSEFKAAALQSEKGIASFLASDMGLSGKYAEEVCERAAVEKTKPCNRLAEGQLARIDLDIRMLSSGLAPNLVFENGRLIDFSPVEMQIYRNREKKYLPTFMHVLDYFFSEMEKGYGNAGARISGIEEKYARIIESQKANLEKLSEKERECAAKAEAIQSSIDSLQKIIDLTGELKKQKNPWEDIRKILKESEFGNLAVKEVKEKEGVMVVNDIGINFRKSARENANDYFEKAKQARRKKEAAQKALERAEKEMAELVRKEEEKGRAAEKRALLRKRRRQKYYEKFRWFFTSDNFLVIGGRDASQNEIIFRKHIEKNDLVLHAEIHGAPLTVVKSSGRIVTPVAIREAAEFAAAYSSAWKRRLGGIDVYWITPEQVSKKAPAGASLAKGAFMIYGRKNYIRNISLKVAVGIRFSRDEFDKIFAQPMCGSVQSVGAHAKYFVTVVPGMMPPGELIKQIRKKLLIKALPEDKPPIEAISSDDFERLLPAGNGDVIG